MNTWTETLERSSGRGVLRTSDGRDFEVAYTARTFQTIHEVNGATVPGLKDAEVHVSGSGFHSLIGKELTLVIEDGQQWECFLADSDGTAVGRGPWPGR